MRERKSIVFQSNQGLTPGVVSGTITKLIQQTMECERIELPVISAGEYAESLSIYIDKDGNMAPVPEGYTVSGIAKKNTIWGEDKSLVLYQIPQNEFVDWTDSTSIKEANKNYHQIIFVPVSLLKENKATLDAISFNEKIGTSSYYGLTNEIARSKTMYVFDRKMYSFDGINEELIEHIKSFIKWGGFFISRYYNSFHDLGTKSLTSMNEANIQTKNLFDWREKIEIYNSQRQKPSLKAFIPYGGEFDTMLQWIAESNGISYEGLINRFVESERENEAYRKLEHIYFGYLVVYPWINRESRYSKFIGGKPYTLNNVCELSGVCLAWTEEKHRSYYLQSHVRRGKFGLRMLDEEEAWSDNSRYAALRAFFYIS